MVENKTEKASGTIKLQSIPIQKQYFCAYNFLRTIQQTYKIIFKIKFIHFFKADSPTFHLPSAFYLQ